MQLFEQDSVCDLVCRGFSREEVLARCGVDPGYHGIAVRSELVGVDRVAYKIAYVREHLSDDELRAALTRYGRCELSKDELLGVLGISAGTSGKLIRVRDVFETLGLGDAFREVDRVRRLTDMQRGMVEAHGVDNPFKLDEFQQAATRTREWLYGGPYTLSSESTLAANARATFVEHLKDEQFRQDLQMKKVATWQQTLGVDHPMHSEAVRQRMHERLVERGLRNASGRMTKKMRQALSDGVKRSYAQGVVKPSGEVRPRKRHVMSDEERERASQRMRAWRAQLTPEEAAAYSEKTRATSRERFGVDHHSKTNEFRQKMSKYMSDPVNRERISQKREETFLARYGVPWASQSPEARARCAERMRDPAVQLHIREVAQSHGRTTTSSMEQHVYERLVEVFGEQDVCRQHMDERYPFACDFYVASRDLFIECNGMWTHGCCWFDEKDEACAARLETWQQRAETNKFYGNAVYTWSMLDVCKRTCARDHGLNYVVFWDGFSQAWWDADLWFSLGCPDGRDWEREYSWLVSRPELSPAFSLPERPQARLRSSVAAAMWANGHEFYRRELTMWRENGLTAHGRVRGALVANRVRYLGKSVDELTDVELLRGMGIAGFVRAHSHFDARTMFQVLQDIGARSVFDPCAGWGERLTFAAALGIVYNGVDVNPAVVEGQRRLIDAWQLTEAVVRCADAASFDASGIGHDAVIACPPYGATEIYSSQGAENLPEDEFARWWSAVVAHALAPCTRWFVLQTNQRMCEVFRTGIIATGFHQVRVVDLDVQASHMQRAGGRITRREHESVIVFEREVLS